MDLSMIISGYYEKQQNSTAPDHESAYQESTITVLLDPVNYG